MALTSASRASAKYCLDVKFMIKLENSYIFAFHKLHKSWRKRKAPPKLYLLERSRTMCDVYLRWVSEAYKNMKGKWR